MAPTISRPIDDGPPPFDPVDPDLGPGEQYPEPAPEVEVGEVAPEQVAEFLDQFGAMVNWLAPSPPAFPDAWVFTDDEINFLAPALARVANNRAQAAAAMIAERSPEFAVAVGLGRYVARNIKGLRNAALELAAAETGDEPAGGDVPDEHQQPYFAGGV